MEVGFLMFLLILISIGLIVERWGAAKKDMADIESEMKHDLDKSHNKERRNRF